MILRLIKKEKTEELLKKITIKGIFCLIIMIVFLFQVNLSANSETEERFGINFPELSFFSLPDLTKFELENGMTFLLLEDHRVPLTTIKLRNFAGSALDEPGKVGLAEITAQLLRNGGTKNYTSNELNEILDHRAMELNINARILSTQLYMDFLSQDTHFAMELLKEFLRYPAFDENALVTAKRIMKSSIARRNDENRDIAEREFKRLVFGVDSPFVRFSEYVDIQNISREDVVNFHKEHFYPNNIFVSIVGDFETKEMKQLVENTFGDWQERKNPPVIDFDEDLVFEQSVNLISRPEADQTWILIGHRAAITQNHPDYIPITILNEILGGGFNSRVKRRVRRHLGLAYSPSAYYSVDYAMYGFFYLLSQTRTDRTAEAIEALIDEVRILQEEPVSKEELHIAKESYLNSFIFKYDEPLQILDRQINYYLYGYAADFLEKFRDKVYDVSVEDIRRVANEYLRPDDFVILAAGNDADFDKPLSEFGNVNEIDISIPAPQGQ